MPQSHRYSCACGAALPALDSGLCTCLACDRTWRPVPMHYLEAVPNETEPEVTLVTSGEAPSPLAEGV